MSEERNWEEEASRDGWRPEDQFDGDPEKWVDAKTFVERGEEILPIVKARLGRQIDSLETRVNELLEGNRNLLQMSERAITKERERSEKEKNELLKELRVERKKAVVEGDGDKFDQADDAIKKLEAPEQQAPAQPSNQEEIVQWFEAHPIYNTNRKAQALLDGFANEVKQSNPSLSGAALLDKIQARVEQESPELFENPNRKKGDPVIPPRGGGGGGEKEKGFSDLPAEAKAAYAQFEKTVPGMTREKYLSHYVWED